jgi:hypothetical protein
MKAPRATYFRRTAERCRLLLPIAIKPGVKQQLRLWARELDNIASRLEARPKRRAPGLDRC